MNIDQILRLRNELMNILQNKQERDGAPRTLKEKIAALREAYGSAWIGMNISTSSYPGPETGKLYPIQRDITEPEPALGTKSFRNAPTTSKRIKSTKNEPTTSGRDKKWRRKL